MNHNSMLCYRRVCQNVRNVVVWQRLRWVFWCQRQLDVANTVVDGKAKEQYTRS